MVEAHIKFKTAAKLCTKRRRRASTASASLPGGVQLTLLLGDPPRPRWLLLGFEDEDEDEEEPNLGHG